MGALELIPASRLLAPLGRLLGAKTGAVGLCVSRDHLGLVQLSTSPDGPVIHAAAALPLPCARESLTDQPEQLKTLLREAWKEHGFKGRNVVSCLPPSELQIFPISFAVAEGADESAALVAELRNRLKDTLDQSVVDYLAIRREDAEATHREALVAVAPRATVLRHLAMLENAGLQVSAIDIGPAALTRLIGFVSAAQARGQFPNVMAINFGEQKSYLSVIWGRRLILDREIEFCGQALRTRLARVLDLDEDFALRVLMRCGFRAEAAPECGDIEIPRTLAEILRPEFAALATEVNATLSYTASRSRGRGIDKIILLGSIAHYPGMDKQIQELLDIPVEVLCPIDAFAKQSGRSAWPGLHGKAGIATACGLALRGFANHG